MIGRASAACVLALAAAAPRAVAGQCGIDQVRSGIAAYRALDLALATELLAGATTATQQSSSACASETARALTYLGATHWLSARLDSARLAFRRAVIHAPRHSPDPFEFPPDMTDAFDDVRRDTRAVALTLPPAAEITRDGETLGIGLTASTSHTVSVEVASSDGDLVRTLYRGPIDASAQGTFVTWDARGPEGNLVASGDYRVEAVSWRSSPGGDVTPVRKVAAALSVRVTPVASPGPSLEIQAAQTTVVVDESRTWAAVGAVAAGVLGAGAVVGIPFLMDGGSGTPARFAVAGAVGVAGIIGLFDRLRDRHPVAPPAGGHPIDSAAAAAAGPTAEPPSRERPVVRIRVGEQWREELTGEADESVAPPTGGGAQRPGGR